MMRRIYDPNVYEYLQPLQPVNTFITMYAPSPWARRRSSSLANFFWSMFKGQEGGRQPVGVQYARVVDTGSSRTRQLGRGPA